MDGSGGARSTGSMSLFHDLLYPNRHPRGAVYRADRTFGVADWLSLQSDWSETLPGLWLEAPALIVSTGSESSRSSSRESPVPEHVGFVNRLARRPWRNRPTGSEREKGVVTIVDLFPFKDVLMEVDGLHTVGTPVTSSLDPDRRSVPSCR